MRVSLAAPDRDAAMDARAEMVGFTAPFSRIWRPAWGAPPSICSLHSGKLRPWPTWSGRRHRQPRAPWPYARSCARVGHLIDHRPADFEARARRINGGPAVELILGAIGGELPSATRADLQARDVRSIVGGHQQDGKMFRILSTSRARPWLQFNPLPLMNANKGSLRCRPRAYGRLRAARHWLG